MKLKSFIFCLLTGISLLSLVRDAVGAQAWVQRFTGSLGAGGNAYAMVVDGSGNLFVAGTWANDFATVKYSNAGVPLWTNRYHGPGAGSDVARAIAVDASGNVFVTGDSANTDPPPYNRDYATIKYSGAGVPLWTNRYQIFTDNAYGTAVAVDAGSNVVVTGYSGGSGVSTIKYSNAGVPLWTNIFHYPGDFAYIGSLAVDSNANVFVAGHASGPGGGDDILIFKCSSSGALLWTNRYNGLGNGNDYGNDIALDSNGNVFLTGGTTVGGQFEFVTIKYSNSGMPVWTNRYKGFGTSFYGGAGEIVVDYAGNVIVTGTSVGSGTHFDFATIKYSNTGVPLWTNRFNRNSEDAAIGLAVDRGNNVFVHGYSSDAITLRYDNTVVAYSSTGQFLWSNFYNGPGNDDDSANAIALDGEGNVFVTGYSRGTNGFTDYATIKLWGRQPIQLNVQPTNNLLVLSWANPTFLLQSAPNATGTFTNIPGATSPRTNTLGAPQQFFRLRLN